MWILVIILLALLSIAVYFLVKFALIIIRVEDAIEESLDILDERYASISKILQTPLFYDSAEVRQVLSDVRGCQDSILYIANVMVNTQEKTVEEMPERLEE